MLFWISTRRLTKFMALAGFGCVQPTTDPSTADSTDDLAAMDDSDRGGGGGTGDTERCDGQPSEWVAADDVPVEMKLAFSSGLDGAYTVPGRL